MPDVPFKDIYVYQLIPTEPIGIRRLKAWYNTLAILEENLYQELENTEKNDSACGEVLHCYFAERDLVTLIRVAKDLLLPQLREEGRPEKTPYLEVEDPFPYLKERISMEEIAGIVGSALANVWEKRTKVPGGYRK